MQHKILLEQKSATQNPSRTKERNTKSFKNKNSQNIFLYKMFLVKETRTKKSHLYKFIHSNTHSNAVSSPLRRPSPAHYQLGSPLQQQVATSIQLASPRRLVQCKQGSLGPGTKSTGRGSGPHMLYHRQARQNQYNSNTKKISTPLQTWSGRPMKRKTRPSSGSSRPTRPKRPTTSACEQS